MEKAKQQLAIGEVLADIDMLIDGAYVEALADGAGAWTGSGNQRVIDMRETRRVGHIVRYGYSVEFWKKPTVEYPLHRDGDGLGFTLCAMCPPLTHHPENSCEPDKS